MDERGKAFQIDDRSQKWLKNCEFLISSASIYGVTFGRWFHFGHFISLPGLCECKNSAGY